MSDEQLGYFVPAICIGHIGCVQVEASSHAFVANHFDVVTVRTDDESRVVARVVVRAQTGCTIVLAACRECRTMEILDLLPILGREREVKRRRPVIALVEAKGSVPA